MQKIILLAVVLVAFGGTAIRAQNKPITVVKLEELQKIYNAPNDTTYVVNFFATWCGPCMMEIPVLNQFYQDHKNTNVQLIYVSLDAAQTLKKLPAKIKKAKMEAPVYLLNESQDFSWLPYVDKRWQGSIPATMIVNSKKKVKAFFETPMEKGQLEFYLKKLGL